MKFTKRSRSKRWELRLHRETIHTGGQTYFQARLLGEWTPPSIPHLPESPPLKIEYVSLTRATDHQSQTHRFQLVVVGSWILPQQKEQLNFHLVVSAASLPLPTQRFAPGNAGHPLA